jgi:hypothetical protein
LAINKFSKQEKLLLSNGRPCVSKPAHNMGYTTMAGEVVNQTVVLLINSSAKLKVSASKPL